MESSGQIQDFLNVLRQRRWQIVLPALFVLTLGVAFAIIVPKKYLVVTRIELRESPLGEESAPEREKFGAEYHVKHYQRVRGVIEGQPELWPEYFELPSTRRSDFIAGVMDDIEVIPLEKTKDRGSSFLDIAYTDTDPQRAERFLVELRDLWIEEVVARDLNAVGDELEVLRDELSLANKLWRKKKSEFNELAKQLGLDPTQPINAKFENRGDSILRQLDVSKEKRSTVDIELAGLTSELAELQEQLRKEPPTVLTETDSSALFEERILATQSLILEKEAEQERYTRLNSRYRRLQDEIDDLRRRLADAELLRDQAKAVSSVTPNPEYERLVKAISAQQVLIQSRVGVRASLDAEIAELERQSLARYQEYETLDRLASESELAWKEVEAKSTARDAKAVELRVRQEAYGRPFNIAQEPEASEEPTEPNPIVIVGVALFLGLGLGLVLAVLAEFARNGFRSVHDLRNVMNVPVLGAINAIVTRAEARRMRARRTVVALSSAIVLGSILWVTLTWHLAPERLPLKVVETIDGLREMML